MIFNLCGHDPHTSQTDRQTGQTDGQTTCDSKTPLCTVVHRAVKTHWKAYEHINCKNYHA